MRTSNHHYQPVLGDVSVLTIIVGYTNAQTIEDCLRTLARLPSSPSFGILICENGGPKAFDSLVSTLMGPESPCAGEPKPLPSLCSKIKQVVSLTLKGGGQPVLIAEATENLGYAGGINAWIEPALALSNWSGIWVLNPDTFPEPDALAALVDYANQHGKGMVASRIMEANDPDVIVMRGLKWRKLLSSCLAVDKGASASRPSDALDVESRIDAPSGASFYTTRDCIERIGLMDESYFLYFEDVEWGMRAKETCGLGYADNSVVRHIGGTTIGSASRRRLRSKLSVYLDFRNRLLFVRRRYPKWLPWAAAISTLRSIEFLVVGGVSNFQAALYGIAAGIMDRTGRPDPSTEEWLKSSGA